MTLRPNKQCGKLTPDLLRHLEDHAAQLPEDYRSFLLESNGGTPVPELIVTHPPSEDEEELFIANFTSIDCSRGTLSIELQVESWHLDYGPSFIPIADDGMGNEFLLSLEKKTLGFVYYRDHEPVSNEGSARGLQWLADSFATFRATWRQSESDSVPDDWEVQREIERQKILDSQARPWWHFWR